MTPDSAPDGAVAWFRRPEPGLFSLHLPARADGSRRHRRKYAEGELDPERSFYFRGPKGKLKLRAQNLEIFMQLAEGVDDATWLHHLRRGDYSGWLREAIKDDELASEVAKIEQSRQNSAAQTRALIKAAIEQRYTGPT